MNMWRRNDRLPQRADDIVIVSFGTYPDGLTRGSGRCADRALEIQRVLENWPVLVYGSFTPTARGDSDPERKFREEILRRSMSRLIYTGRVASSIEEAIAAKKERLPQVVNGRRRMIIVCTDESNSRRAGFVWEKEFGEIADIRISAFGSEHVIEKSHPMTVMRNRWAWLSVNIGLYCLWHIPLIYNWFRKNCHVLHQPTSV